MFLINVQLIINKVSIPSTNNYLMEFIYKNGSKPGLRVIMTACYFIKMMVQC
jgi:hypothetical protein